MYEYQYAPRYAEEKTSSSDYEQKGIIDQSAGAAIFPNQRMTIVLVHLQSFFVNEYSSTM